MNKKGANNTILWVVLVLVGAYFLMQGGYLSSNGGGGGGSSGNVPSDLQQTHTLSFKDELATSETAVYSASWYLFNGDGSYFNSGTTGAASGTDTVTLNIGKHYDGWVWNSSSVASGEAGYLPTKFSIDVNNDPNDATTVKLKKSSGFTMSGVDDPVDLNSALTSIAKGSTQGVRIKYSLNVSNAASLNPVIVLQVNKTTVEDVTISNADNKGGKYEEITCPDRLQPVVATNIDYCFKRDKIALSSDGLIIADAAVLFSADTAVSSGDDNITAFMIDTTAYLKPGYENINDVIFAQEDGSDADIGVGDSALGNVSVSA